jgi:hypothetical protein
MTKTQDTSIGYSIEETVRELDVQEGIEEKPRQFPVGLVDR